MKAQMLAYFSLLVVEQYAEGPQLSPKQLQFKKNIFVGWIISFSVSSLLQIIVDTDAGFSEAMT